MSANRQILYKIYNSCQEKFLKIRFRCLGDKMEAFQDEVFVYLLDGISISLDKACISSGGDDFQVISKDLPVFRDEAVAHGAETEEDAAAHARHSILTYNM